MFGVALLFAVFGMQAAAPPARAALTGDVQISGHGYGHGRGLSQWGARGYAVDHGWTSAQILGHYYGGTAAGSAGNIGIGVELLSRAGRDLVVTAPDLRINGGGVGTAAVLVRRNGDGTFTVLRGAGCGGPWSGWQGGLPSGLVISAGGPAADPANHVQICEAGQVRGYRGEFQVLSVGSTSAVVNRLLLEDYLRGVVPREMPASWADAGGGRGAQALQSQSVAARSYAIASPRNSYATTCDTISCQVYGGEYTRSLNGTTRTSLEDPRSDAAIAATRGQVRLLSGRVARTEFSASSGGWTAGGTFPAVQDLGDPTAGNPNSNWSVAIPAGTLASRLGTPPITGLSVTQRNGLGADGGRVLRVVVDTTGGQHVFTGAQFRSKLGLKSDWFRLNVVSYTHSLSYARALYADALRRPASDGEARSWAGQIAAGRDRAAIARSFTESSERMHRLVDEVYAAAVRRAPDAGGYRTWVGVLARGGDLNQVNAAVYGSAESRQALGGGDLLPWVDGLYRGLLGRPAAPSEQAVWASRAGQLGTREVAYRISTSAEARQRRLHGYYQQFLQRPADPGGVRSYMTVMQGRGDFQVPTILAASQEYWSKSAQRFP